MRVDRKRQSIDDDLIERALGSDRDALPNQPAVPNAELLSVMRNSTPLHAGSVSHAVFGSVFIKGIWAILAVSVIGTGAYFAWSASEATFTAATPLSTVGRPTAIDSNRTEPTAGDRPTRTGSVQRIRAAEEAHTEPPIAKTSSTSEHTNHDLLMPKTPPRTYTNPKASVNLRTEDSSPNPTFPGNRQ